jgi:hypothetical protein
MSAGEGVVLVLLVLLVLLLLLCFVASLPRSLVVGSEWEREAVRSIAGEVVPLCSLSPQLLRCLAIEADALPSHCEAL